VLKRLASPTLFLFTLAAVTQALEPLTPALDPEAVRRVEDYRRALAMERPRVVLLGNSMLGHGVNEIHFSMRTGVHAIKMWDGGVAAAWNHLMIKNVLAEHPNRPEMVVVFFTDQYLTDATFRVHGQYKPRLDALRRPVEPLLDQLAYQKDRRDALAYLITDLWPLDRKREIVKPGVERFVKHRIGRALEMGGLGEVDAAIDRVFADSNLNVALFSKAQIEAMTAPADDRQDFGTLLNRSFLSSDIAMAQRAGIRLAFVRIKRVTAAEAQQAGRAVQNDYMSRYVADLRTYLESQGSLLLDFTQDPRLRVEHYGQGDHLNEQGRLLFTAMLAEALEGRLPEVRGDDAPFAELAQVREPIILEGPFKENSPGMWSAPLPNWAACSSNPRDTYRSVLELLEDGTPLGPRNAFMSDIRSHGAGRYVHWGGFVYFATSDNSDPNTNGRTYSYRFTLPP